MIYKKEYRWDKTQKKRQGSVTCIQRGARMLDEVKKNLVFQEEKENKERKTEESERVRQLVLHVVSKNAEIEALKEQVEQDEEKYASLRESVRAVEERVSVMEKGRSRNASVLVGNLVMVCYVYLVARVFELWTEFLK